MKGSYKSRWVIVIVVVIAAIAAFWFWQGRNDSQSAAPGATKQAQQSPAGGRRGMRSGPLAPVQAATAVEQAVPRYLTGLGTITAANTVTVRSRVDGQLIALHFQEGQQVKAGDLLAEIDPSQFKVALAQAQGQLAKDKATLANARRDLARYQQLAKTNLVSRQELDAQQALVSETEGTIKADEASVASAQLQLRNCGDHPDASYRFSLYPAGKRYRYCSAGAKSRKTAGGRSLGSHQLEEIK